VTRRETYRRLAAVGRRIQRVTRAIARHGRHPCYLRDLAQACAYFYDALRELAGCST
jgi:hypothetical protein